MGNLSSSKSSPMDYIKYYSSVKLSSTISQENTKYIILMRHGERQDCDDVTPPTIKNVNDPELSSIGIQQALDIGHQLKLNLMGINFSEINIFTSPFTRTMQTGLNTANGFDANDSINKNIYIIKNLAENGYDNGFENNLNKGPIYYGRKDKRYKNLYNQLILPYYDKKKYKWNDFDFESKLRENETDETIKDRYYTVIADLYNFIKSKNTNNGNSLNIISTHQYGVSFMMEKIMSILNESKSENEKINFDFKSQRYFFCCTYCFKITKEKEFNYLGQLNPNILRRDILILKNENGKMLDPNKRNNRYLAIIRHGERIDSTPFRKNQELPKYDPELTFEGMMQAMNIGVQLRNLFRYKYNIEINELSIYNSPSARTLQTGILTAGAFDYMDKIEKVIRIITDLNETSVKGGFENNKEESPIFYYKDKDKNLNNLYKKYIDSLIKGRNYRYSNLDFSSMLGKESFEDGEVMKKRAQTVITNIKGYVESSFTKDNNTLNIVSTHQLNVSMIVDYLISELNKQRKEQGVEEIKINDQSFGYCYCFLFKIDQNNEFSYLGLLKPNAFNCFEDNLTIN